MKFLILRTFAIALLMASAISCKKSSTNNNTVNNDPNTVTMSGMAFVSNGLHVTVGTTVKWVNNDNMVHTVTADDNSYNSGDLAAGATFSHTFSTAGTYTYHCKYHSGMTGTVWVQ